MQTKTIIAVSGEMAAGKGEVARYIEKYYLADNTRSSDVFRRVLDVLGMEQTRETVSEMSRVLRIGFGESVAVDTILKDVDVCERTLYVVDGLRRPEEIAALRVSDCRVHFIYMTVDMRVRYDRMVERDENVGDREKSFEEFLRNHDLNAEKTVEALKPLADDVISNDGSLEDLYHSVDKIMQELGFQKVER